MSIGQKLTILPVLSTLQSLETRAAEFGKGLARREGHRVAGCLRRQKRGINSARVETRDVRE
jgi:hypothetical protein